LRHYSLNGVFIKISKNDKGERIVAARELHAYLGSKKDFTNWMKYRIQQYGLVENIDFVKVYAKIGVNPVNDGIN